MDKKKSIRKLDFIFEVEYDGQEGKLYIGFPHSSPAKYQCNTSKELKDTICQYIDDYIIENEKYLSNEYDLEK